MAFFTCFENQNVIYLYIYVLIFTVWRVPKKEEEKKIYINGNQTKETSAKETEIKYMLNKFTINSRWSWRSSNNRYVIIVFVFLALAKQLYIFVRFRYDESNNNKKNYFFLLRKVIETFVMYFGNYMVVDVQSGKIECAIYLSIEMRISPKKKNNNKNGDAFKSDKLLLLLQTAFQLQMIS